MLFLHKVQNFPKCLLLFLQISWLFTGMSKEFCFVLSFSKFPSLVYFPFHLSFLFLFSIHMTSIVTRLPKVFTVSPIQNAPCSGWNFREFSNLNTSLQFYFWKQVVFEFETCLFSYRIADAEIGRSKMRRERSDFGRQSLFFSRAICRFSNHWNNYMHHFARLPDFGINSNPFKWCNGIPILSSLQNFYALFSNL